MNGIREDLNELCEGMGRLERRFDEMEIRMKENNRQTTGRFDEMESRMNEMKVTEPPCIYCWYIVILDPSANSDKGAGDRAPSLER